MYFTKERIRRILEELHGYIYQDRISIPDYKMKQGEFKGAESSEYDLSDWDDFKASEQWGGKHLHFWFKTDITIPENYDGKAVIFEVTTGGEGGWDALNPQFLVFINGKAVQGLDVNHREVLLSEKAKAGDKYSISLYAYSGTLDRKSMLTSFISILDRDVEKFFYNVRVPLEIANLLDKEDKRSIDILEHLNHAVNILDLRKPMSKEFYSTLIEANDYLENEFYGKYCGDDEVKVVCVGHTHIDVAWLWPLSQTREKAVRSFSTVLNLMKQYPEYIFMSSQPQLYKFVKEDYPEVYEEIKKMVKEGRWEPEGAMWLEADCNLTSGESLVRQLLFGTRFFKEEFGVDNKILWLPDVFGYSAALPQILKKSGIDYFMTTKISWSEYNKLPYDTFVWKGIDGTEIFTHFITAKDYDKTNADPSWGTTYNGFLNPSQIMGSWQRYQQKNLSDEVLVCYGFGDGGGGPTKEMLENAKRLEKGIPGAPKVVMGNSRSFFERIEKKTANNKKLPKWVGELYLEYHRGTYTSMARNKKFNRKSEFLYEDVEFLSTMNVLAAKARQYPQKKINEGWETILLNQFHDIIPGSSIKMVYEDSKDQYVKLIADGQKLKDKAVEGIAAKINTKNTSIVVFNQLSFTRNDVVGVKLPSGWKNAAVKDIEGNDIVTQLTDDGKIIFFTKDVPAKGYKTYNIEKLKSTKAIGNMEVNKKELQNKFFQLKLDNDANIVSIYDNINNREILKTGERANVLQAFEDKPHNFDAWDINIYYSEKMWEVNDVESIEVIEKGPVRGAIKVTKKFLDSKLVQTIYVYNDIPRIDFSNWIDWKEKQILLKAAFPVDIHSDKATYEIQYGNVERPTHWNTSWDYARFEVCAHKWADLSEGDYGVSLLNDCKYGHDIKESVMRITMLKSAVSPNEDADREVHEFTYSLYPHTGDWKNAGTVQMAYSLNCPMYTSFEEAHEGILPDYLSLLSIDKENVVVEVIKKAENGDGYIVRLYECYNNRSNVNLKFFKNLSSVKECDLMENDIKNISYEGDSFSFEIKPYEIKTFKLSVK